MRFLRGKRLAAATALALGLSGLGTAAYAQLIYAPVTVPVEVSDNEILNDNDIDILEEILEEVEVEEVDVDVLEDIIEESDVANGVLNGNGNGNVVAVVLALLDGLL